MCHNGLFQPQNLPEGFRDQCLENRRSVLCGILTSHSNPVVWKGCQLHSFLNQYHEVCLINNLVAVFALMTIQEVCNVSSRVRIQSSHGSRGCMCLRCQCFDILSVPPSWLEFDLHANHPLFGNCGCNSQQHCRIFPMFCSNSAWVNSKTNMQRGFWINLQPRP